jgi:CRP-like cAMP-binding protein
MISLETLRRYPFFAQLDENQLKELAMIAEEVSFKDGEVILEEGKQAESLYFLMKGAIDLYYTIEEGFSPQDSKQVFVYSINPGEPFGISTLIEPFVFTSTARSMRTSRVIQINVKALRALFEKDMKLENILLRRVSKAAIKRLHSTRVQLAAAWA